MTDRTELTYRRAAPGTNLVGEWDEPNRPACPSAAKLWDTPERRDRYPDIRDLVDSCCLPDEHEGPHRAGRWQHSETWTDDDPRAVSRG